VNEEILNLEDEILLRGIDCNVRTMIDNNSGQLEEEKKKKDYIGQLEINFINSKL
jgi:hypothetical protein